MLSNCASFTNNSFGHALNIAAMYRMPKSTLDFLDRVQRRAIRLIGESAFTDKLDSFALRRNVKDLILFYQFNQGHYPQEVSKVMPPREKQSFKTNVNKYQ